MGQQHRHADKKGLAHTFECLVPVELDLVVLEQFRDPNGIWKRFHMGLRKLIELVAHLRRRSIYGESMASETRLCSSMQKANLVVVLDLSIPQLAEPLAVAPEYSTQHQWYADGPHHDHERCVDLVATVPWAVTVNGHVVFEATEIVFVAPVKGVAIEGREGHR